MGYIIAVVFLLVLVPVIFLLLSRRAAGGSGIASNDRGVTALEPAAEETPPVPSATSTKPTERKSPAP